MKRNNKYAGALKTFIVLLLSTVSLSGSAQQEYCCERNFIFPEFSMPSEQERNISGFLSGAWNSYILKSGADKNNECPIRITILSFSGTIDLEKMIEKITAAAQKREPAQDSDEGNVKKNADYVWKGKLELTYIERIVPGKDEPAYGGGTEYVPGYVVGGWKFTIRLYDSHRDEIVKEASTTWTGSDIGFYKNLRNEYDEGKSSRLYIDILEELYNREFADLKQIIVDYEKAPGKAEFESKEIKVNPEKTKRITFNVTDESGGKSRPWQRLAVKTESGILNNGTPCCESDDETKFYSFLCGEGTVTIEYKAPDDNETTFDHITVYNGCIIANPDEVPMSSVDIQDEIGSLDIALENEGYTGTITVTKSWDYTKHYDRYSATYSGKQTVNYNGIFKPSSYMEGMEGQPMKMFVASSVTGTWTHNEQKYCEEGEGCGDCKGLVYEEFGTGPVSDDSKKGIIIITNLFPTDKKEVAQQMAQFGMVNWYDIAVPSENVETQNRTKHDTNDGGCQWSNSTSTTNILGAQMRYKLKDISMLQGNISWSSKKETTEVSVTDMTEAIYEQAPFDPEKNGSDYTYTITWNLKAL